MQTLLLALSFLTTLPVPQVEFRPGALGESARWFPAVGLLVGVLLSTFHLSLFYLFSPMLSAALTVTLWAVLTGGLHLDGLADCCDGLLAAVSPERRLEIMKDPRIGAFGAIGIALFLMLKVTSLSSVTNPMAALLLAPTVARWTLLLVTRQPMVRPGGLGDEFGKNISLGTISVAGLLPLALLIQFAGWQSLLAICVAIVATFALIRFAQRRLGGVTGDVFGLVAEMSELVVLLVFAMRF